MLILSFYFAWDANICDKQLWTIIVNLVTTLLLLVTHMVLIFCVCQKLVKKIGITQCLKRMYKDLKTCMQATRSTNEAETDVEAEADVEAESDTGSLPDRLINPGEYEPFLPTTEEHTTAELTEDKELDNEDPRRLTSVYTTAPLTNCLSAIYKDCIMPK